VRRKESVSTIIPGSSLPGDGKPAVQQSQLGIDYPQAGEPVARGHYAIRISGCDGECQVSIDDGDWQSCRSADGYWWYDWCPTETGRQRISARVRSGNKWLKVQRTCEVK